jgi:hypothetical protein
MIIDEEPEVYPSTPVSHIYIIYINRVIKGVILKKSNILKIRGAILYHSNGFFGTFLLGKVNL